MLLSIVILNLVVTVLHVRCRGRSGHFSAGDDKSTGLKILTVFGVMVGSRGKAARGRQFWHSPHI